MNEIIIILLCIPLYVINSFCDKHISAKHSGGGVVYNVEKFLIGSIILLPLMLTGDGAKLKAGVLICGAACGIMYAISKTIILKGYEKTSVAFMTFCHSAGMIMPCIYGNFFWDETLSLPATVGIMLAVFSAVLLKGGDGKKKSYTVSGVAIGIVVFLASGGVMMCQKFMGIYFAQQSVSAYNLYSFFVAFLLLSFFVKPQKGTIKSAKGVLPFALGSSLSLCIISLVMTAIAGKVPSVIMFPLFNGIGIILVCIGSVFVFKEKMNLKKSIGLAVGLAGLCLVNL